MTGNEILALLIVFVLALPFVLVCRLLWHAGSWFKRKDRR